MVTDHSMTGHLEKKRIEDSLRESSFPPAVAGANAPSPPSEGEEAGQGQQTDYCHLCEGPCDPEWREVHDALRAKRGKAKR